MSKTYEEMLHDAFCKCMQENHGKDWIDRYDPEEQENMRREFYSGAEWHANKSPWISVKDKLPEPEQEVFLYDRDSVKHYAIGWLRKKKGYCKSKWFVTNGYVTDESITHWMPIPKFNV